MQRLPAVDQDELPPDQQDLVVSVLQDRPLNIYATIANNPPVLTGLRAFLGRLWADTGLTERERELVILSVARTMDSTYEWQQHVRIATGSVCTEREVSAIGRGELEPFSDREQLLLEYQRALIERSVTDELHDRMAAEFTESQIVGVAALSGGYHLLALLIEAFQIELEDPFVGWSLEER